MEKLAVFKMKRIVTRLSSVILRTFYSTDKKLYQHLPSAIKMINFAETMQIFQNLCEITFPHSYHFGWIWFISNGISLDWMRRDSKKVIEELKSDGNDYNL